MCVCVRVCGSEGAGWRRKKEGEREKKWRERRSKVELQRSPLPLFNLCLASRAACRRRPDTHTTTHTQFSTMGLQGYVGNAGDADRVRAGEARRAAERAAAADSKKAIEAKHASGLREFGAGASEVRG